MQAHHYAALLLLAWLAWRVLTVVILPFIRDRGGGAGRSVRYARPRSDGAFGISGLVAIVAGAGMLALIALWILGLAFRYFAGTQSLDAVSLSAAIAPAVLALGLIEIAVGWSPRDLPALVDCVVLAALAALFAYGSLFTGRHELSPQTRLTSALLLAAAALLTWRAVAFVTAAHRGGDSPPAG